MTKNLLNIDEKRWQADADADTMARYNEIMSDAKRRNAALKAAKAKAEDYSKSADRMRRVAGGSNNTKSSGKSKTQK